MSMKAKKQELPELFRIVSEKSYEDGSVTWEVEYNDDFKNLYKKSTGKKRATEKGMSKWLLEAITKIAKE